MSQEGGIVRLEYRTNNSGGSWWLNDADWVAMEAAGWEVEWVKDKEPLFQGQYKDGRYMGALATTAEISTDDPKATIRQWETLVGQNAADEGCNCCGPPHDFYWEDINGGRHHLSDFVVRQNAVWF